MQLVLDGGVNGPDEVNVPAEQENQEALSLGSKITRIRQFTARTRKRKRVRSDDRFAHIVVSKEFGRDESLFQEVDHLLGLLGCIVHTQENIVKIPNPLDLASLMGKS